MANIKNVCKIANQMHLPVGVRNNDLISTFNKWWKNRSIPKSRSGLKTLLDILNLSVSQQLIDKCFGLSLSDQYWICPVDKPLTWADINFFDNPFSDDIGNILFGSKMSSQDVNFMSPDCTSDGQLKKKWKIINGQRCLIKGGSNPYQQEPINEVIASLLMDKLGVEHINYTVLWDNGLPYSVCKDFINTDTEFVSAYQICSSFDNESTTVFEHFIKCAENFGIPNVQKSINEMLVVDFIIANVDRHFGNFGAIRNANTLQYLGMAPIFDNGTSLWHNTLDNFINASADIESSTFCDKLAEQLELVTDFSWIDFGKLNNFAVDVESVLKMSKYICNGRKQFLCQAIDERIKMLKEYVTNL
jgi:hypothetical protein